MVQDVPSTTYLKMEVKMTKNKLRLKIIERFETQEKFAVRSGINEAIVSKIVRGLREPTEEHKAIFSKLLDTPVAELFRNTA